MLPYVRGITFSCKVIDLGNPLEVVLSHPNPKPLAQTASSAVYALRRAGGHCEMRSVRNPGIPEDWLESRPKARTLGLTLEELARQARAALLVQRPSGFSAAGKRSGSTCACPRMSGIPLQMSKGTCSVP